MKKVIIKFTFDEKELGEGWFNIYNLELMLYSKEYTKRELLNAEDITDKIDKGE